MKTIRIEMSVPITQNKKGAFEEKKKPLVYFSFDPDVILVCRQ